MRLSPLDGWTAEKIGCPKSLDRDALESWQLSRLNQTLGIARKSLFYQKKLDLEGGLHNLGEIDRLPFTYPGDIAESGLRMLCVSQGQIERVVTLTTSGTTGLPKKLYFTREDQELTVDYFARGLCTLLQPGESMLILFPGQRPGGVGELIERALSRIPARPIPYGVISNLADATKTLVQTKADTLVGMPIQVLALARYSAAVAAPVSVKRALLSADNVPRVLVRELKRIWDCEVYEHYGMTEMGLGGAIDCDAHAGYHLREADLFFEIIDPLTGKALPAGEYGEVVFTTLTRVGMPLIRYRTGDMARFLPEPCPCGTVLKRMERISSRLNGRVGILEDFRLDMPALDEALLALDPVVDFTAELWPTAAGRKLIVHAATLDCGEALTEKQVLTALRSIAGLEWAEKSGRLKLEAGVAKYPDIPSLHQGKRRLYTSNRLGGERK